MNPPSQSVEVEQTVKLTAIVWGEGKENFTYQWRRNGINIDREFSDTLTLSKITKDLGGSYKCVVQNEYGDSETSGAIILSQLSSVFVSLNQTYISVRYKAFY